MNEFVKYSGANAEMPKEIDLQALLVKVRFKSSHADRATRDLTNQNRSFWSQNLRFCSPLWSLLEVTVIKDQSIPVHFR